MRLIRSLTFRPASLVFALLAALPGLSFAADAATAHRPATMADVLAQSKPSDWIRRTRCTWSFHPVVW
jgi:hypothetical protein